jgi:hypothetical protein
MKKAPYTAHAEILSGTTWLLNRVVELQEALRDLVFASEQRDFGPSPALDRAREVLS